MTSTLYLTVDEALHLHQLLIQRFGGAPGVRDLGLVESALFRPRSGYYQTISEQAAALAQSFACNHGFIDGNKRMAFAAAAVFLDLNGYRLTVTTEEGEHFLLEDILQEGHEVSTLARWFERHMSLKIAES